MVPALMNFRKVLKMHTVYALKYIVIKFTFIMCHLIVASVMSALLYLRLQEP
jgi:hypothetical protein